MQRIQEHCKKSKNTFKRMDGVSLKNLKLSNKLYTNNFQISNFFKYLRVLDEVGLNFNKIEQKFRKLSSVSVETQKLEYEDKTENFRTLIQEIEKVKINQKIKINGHLDAVRGIFTVKNTHEQNLFVSVSEDCLVKLWRVDAKIKDKNEQIQPISTFREHTGQLFTIDGGQLNNNDIVFFTAGTEDCIKLWHTVSKDKPQNLKCIGSFVNENKQSLQFSDQVQSEIIWGLKYKNSNLLTSASDGIVRLFNTSIQTQQNKYVSQIKFKKQFQQKGCKYSVIEDFHTAIQWVGNKAFLSACSNSPRVHLWDVERSKIVQKYLYEIQKMKDDKANLKRDSFLNLFQINSLKYHSQTKNILAACQDKMVRIFSYDDAKIIKKLDNGVNEAVSCLQLYKYNFIVAGCQNGTLKIWDRRTYKLLINEQAHRTKYDEGILCLKTTDQGIFTGGTDGVINFLSI